MTHTPWLLALTLAACGGANASTPEAESTAEPSESTAERSLCNGDEQVFFECAAADARAAVCVAEGRAIYREERGADRLEMAPEAQRSPLSNDLATGFTVSHYEGDHWFLIVRDVLPSGDALLRTVEADRGAGRLGQRQSGMMDETECTLSVSRLDALESAAAGVARSDPPSSPSDEGGQPCRSDADCTDGLTCTEVSTCSPDAADTCEGFTMRCMPEGA